MENQMKHVRRWVPAVGVAVLALTTACADTTIHGVVKDEDLNTVELMLSLARGINSEFADNYVAGNQIQTLPSVRALPTDELANDATDGVMEQGVVGDYRARIHPFPWAQTHEAVWATLYGDIRMSEVLENYETTPLVARIYVMAGHAERQLGELFCQLIYNYGKDGGVLLGGDGPYDPSRLVPNDSAFRRAIAMFERALEWAEAGVAAGETDDNFDETEGRSMFDPEHLVQASHAGLAQAHAWLGDWATAVQHARMVDDEFEDWVLTDTEVDGGLDFWDQMYSDDEHNLFRTPGALLWPDDPRLGLVKCGEWKVGVDLTFNPGLPLTSSSSTARSLYFDDFSQACGHLNDEFRSESNQFPLYVSTKYIDDSADPELSSGAEMRLLEAEAALRSGNLGEFKAQVDRARAARGLGPIAQPAAAGALEYPNAEDDGWSILDRERYLEGFLEGRRFYDMRRWEHPYWTDTYVDTNGVTSYRTLLPRHSGESPDPTSSQRVLNDMRLPNGKFTCAPIPSQECDTNASIQCPVLTGPGV